MSPSDAGRLYSPPGDNCQTMAVLRQRMAHVTQLAFPAITLAIKPGVRISGACMGRVRAFLAMKIPLGVAPRSPVAIVLTFGTLFIDAQASINVPSTEK